MIMAIKNSNKFASFKTRTLNCLEKLKTKKYVNLYTIIIFLFSLFMVSPIFFNYFFGDDTTFHAANIAVRGSSLFNTFSKIIPEIGNNFGYGIGIFYPMLPHFLGGLFLNFISIFGLGEYAALKIIKFIAIFGSGISMYLFASKLFKNKNYGLIASLFYISSSYFFVDIYSRDALNESFVFIFIPLIFLGIYYLFCENDRFKFYLSFIIGYVGMMYSHLVVSVWFTLIFILFLLLFIKDIFKKQNLIPLIISAILILIFTSLFTVPLVEHMLNGEYVIFNLKQSSLFWTMDLKRFFVQISDITNGENYLYINFNIIVILLSLVALFKLFTKRVTAYRKKFIVGFLLIVIVSMTLVSNDTIWYYTPDFLNNIQFPWRACTFAVFGISLFAVEGLDVFYNLFKKKFVPIASILIIAILLANVYYNIQNIQIVEALPYNVNNGMGWDEEYLPIETKNNMKYFEKRKDDEIKVNKGNAEVEIIDNNVPNMEFKVTDIKGQVTLELPRLYYLGYKIVDEDGNEIKHFKNDKGFVSVKIDNNGKYYVSYPGTTAYRVAKVVCILTTVLCVCVIIFKVKKRGKTKN